MCPSLPSHISLESAALNRHYDIPHLIRRPAGYIGAFQHQKVAKKIA